MEVIETGIEGLLILRARIFEDDRGSFFESFNQRQFSEWVGSDHTFVQDNQSISKKGVVRGLHLQRPPYAQGKLVRVVKGRVVDVAVDVRPASSTYGKHYAIELSADEPLMFWIPPGFAHGFSVLEDDSVFLYKCTHYYHKESEMCIAWNDADLHIDWKVETPIVSEKDQEGTSFASFQSPF